MKDDLQVLRQLAEGRPHHACPPLVVAFLLSEGDLTHDLATDTVRLTDGGQLRVAYAGLAEGTRDDGTPPASK